MYNLSLVFILFYYDFFFPKKKTMPYYYGRLMKILLFKIFFNTSRGMVFNNKKINKLKAFKPYKALCNFFSFKSRDLKFVGKNSSI